MKKLNKADLTNGNVSETLAKLAIPIIGSSLLQFTYNIIDMIWVGILGSNAVAAIGSSSLFINIGNAVNSMAVIGTGVKTSHAAGRKDDREASAVINAGIIINTILGLIFASLFLFASRSLISYIDVKNAAVEKDAAVYLRINSLIIVLSFFNMMYTRVLGSFGNNKLGFKINACGVIINIILDPVCIYVFKFGTAGAAVSTLAANLIMFFMFKITSKGLFKYNREISFTRENIKEIIRLGFPMAFQRVLFTFVNIILAKIIAFFGAEAIAAQKIGSQIESVAYMAIGGLNGAVAAFTGQNFGVKFFKRIKEGYKSALKIGIFYAFIIAAVFLLFNNQIIKIFINDEKTMEIASDYLKVIAFSQIFSAAEMISNGFFTGIGEPKIPAVISITFTVLRIPMALLLVKFTGVTGIWLSICISSILKGSTAFICYERKKKYLK